MAEYLSPGVYVEEFDSGIKAMEGVGTSTAGFIGMAQKGPLEGKPVSITSFAEYQRRFGTYLPESRYGQTRFMPYTVEQFFANGGASCYCMRVKGKNVSKAATYSQGDENAGTDAFVGFEAANEGSWGNSLTVVMSGGLRKKALIKEVSETIISVDKPDIFHAGDIVCVKNTTDGEGTALKFGMVSEIKESGLKITMASDTGAGFEADNTLFLYEPDILVTDGSDSEKYESVSFRKEALNYIENSLSKSYLVRAVISQDKFNADTFSALFQDKSEIDKAVFQFQGGSDGKEEDYSDISKLTAEYEGTDNGPGKRSGLAAFLEINDVNIMAMPGITDVGLLQKLVTHCENLEDRFAVLDMPYDCCEVSALQAFKENFDSEYAALYHPWIQQFDIASNKNAYFPPSGSIMGIYARTDSERGVHKAPANEIVKNCTGLSVTYNEAEQGKLNPHGINLIRAIPGAGIRVWGARTCSSNSSWRYINVRRLFIYIEQSIKANTSWVVFEPNDEQLWSRVEGTIKVFLTTLWRNGALTGSSEEEAFFVNVGNTTMTQDDILNGRLICVIGVAPVRPAEFVIFRITQKMQETQ